MKLICVFNKFLTGFDFFPHRVFCQSFLRCNDCFNMQRLALKWECPALKQVADSILLADGNSDRMIQHHHQQPNHQYWFSAVNWVHARKKSLSSFLHISGRAPHSTPSTSTWTVSKSFCVHSKVLSRSACRLYPGFLFWFKNQYSSPSVESRRESNIARRSSACGLTNFWWVDVP